MNPKNAIKSTSLFSVIIIAGCSAQVDSHLGDVSQKNSTQTEKIRAVSKVERANDAKLDYWTCSMHPQVHKSEPGRCPICGMPLIHVDHTQKNNPEVTEQVQTNDGVDATVSQIQNSQLNKFIVHKKDIVFTIPVSGRLTSSREISIQIYESDLAYVKVGYEISGTLSSDPAHSLKGTIQHIDNFVEPSSRTVRITAQLSSSANPYLAETSFHGDIQFALKNQIAIPEDAVLFTGKKTLTYVFSSGNKFSARELVLGLKSKNEYQVLQGLKENEVVSANSNFLIDSESKIRGQ